MDPITVSRHFRLWSYGIGHSQLVLHSPAGDGEAEHVNVLFEDVRGIKLRTSYEPLVLTAADGQLRNELLAYAGIPALTRRRTLCVLIGTTAGEADDYVICARANILAVPETQDGTRRVWPQVARRVHVLEHTSN